MHRNPNMKDEEAHPTPHRKRMLYILMPLALVLILFPGLVKLIANHVVLPARFADPDIPVSAGRIDRLGYTGMTAINIVVDIGNHLQFILPQVKIAYTPWSLIDNRYESMTADVTSESFDDFAAMFTARDIHLSSDGISAAISATCSRIRSGRYTAGPFTFSTELAGKKAELEFDVPLQDGLLNARMSLHADWETNAAYSVKTTVPITSGNGDAVDLAGLASGMDELLVSGHAEALLSGGTNGTDLALTLALDSTEWPAHALSISNLHTVCAMHFPGAARSLPDQRLTADRVTFGEMQFDQLNIHYQLEPDRVVFIEDLDVNWCDGRVSLYSTRYGPGTTNISTRLYCDRLSLEQVLASFGLEKFSASGQLNGRLPMRWDERGLTVDRGFLFTTPGRGGTFAFDTAEAAASIIPADSLQGGQLGLISAALADFNYDWITMTFNSEGENLMVVIEVTGEPAEMLPFVYDAQKGSFVSAPPNSGQGTLQPMKFRLNLTVPFNQLFCYASGINRQWNLFKQTQ